MDINMPKQQIKFNKYIHKSNPWITKGIMNSIKHKDKLVYKLNKTNNIQRKTELKSKLRSYQNILQKVKRKAKLNYWNHKFNSDNSNIKETWKNINTLLNRNKNKQDLPIQIKTNDKVLVNKYDIANTLNNHYIKIGHTCCNIKILYSATYIYLSILCLALCPHKVNPSSLSSLYMWNTMLERLS